MTGHILHRRDAHLVWVTLQHPGKYNAMTRAMWQDLKLLFDDLAQDTVVRCVVLQGANGHFCSGGDIAEYPGFRFDPVQLQNFHEREVWGALQAMLDCPVPIVAHIEGNCMGAGVEMASCCDLRIASASARFGAPIARLGFPMAPREAALVARAVGSTTSRAMLLAADVFDAPHMLACNFLTRVVGDGQLAAHVQALAQRIAALAPQAARMNKQTLSALNRPAVLSKYAQGAIKSVANWADDPVPGGALDAYAYADSAEHREGIAAFLEKRNANF